MGSTECPECGELFDNRGFVNHLVATEGYGRQEAKDTFDRLNGRSSSSPSPSSSDWTPPSMSGNSDDGGTDAPPDMPVEEEPEHVRNDPDLQRLDKEIARREREARLKRLEQYIDEDDGSDDLLETLSALREAGLIDNGDGKQGGEDRQIVSELRTLRREMNRSGGRGGRGGRGAVERAAAEGGDDLLSTAISAGVSDPDVLSQLASSAPEVKKAEIEAEREAERWDRRRQLVDSALENISESGALSAAIELFSGGNDEQRQQRQQQPAQRGAVDWEAQPAHERGGGEGAAEEPSGGEVSAVREQFQDAVEEAEEEADDEPITQEFRSPPDNE